MLCRLLPPFRRTASGTFGSFAMATLRKIWRIWIGPQFEQGWIWLRPCKDAVTGSLPKRSGALQAANTVWANRTDISYAALLSRVLFGAGDSTVAAWQDRAAAAAFVAGDSNDGCGGVPGVVLSAIGMDCVWHSRKC
jgi:hypothetical protein